MYDNEFNTTGYPLAYLITFRTYGSWLPGDKRGTVTKHHKRFGSLYLPHDKDWDNESEKLLKSPPVELKGRMRLCVRKSFKETCRVRGWELLAVNVRTNHVHTVVSCGTTGPGKVLSALKANATRALRQEGLWKESHSPWVHKGSRRFLWYEGAVWKAVEYVVEGQGGKLPEF